MELDPQPRPTGPAKQPQPPRVDRPASGPEPESKPEVLASREDPEPPVPRKSSPTGLHYVALLLLTIGGYLLHLSKDVKTMSDAPVAGPVEVVPDEIVVDLKDDISDAAIAALNARFGITLRYNSIHSRNSKLMIAKVPPGQAAVIVAGLRASDLVEAADENTISHAFASTWKPNDPEYPRQWHLQMLRLEEAWVDAKGDGAVVAVVDTGVGLPDPSQLRKLRDFDRTQFTKGHDFVNDDDIPEDMQGHGSHVAATIAESTDNGILGAGVAPKATIMPLRVLNDNGQGTQADIVSGIRYAADNGANVINLSLGSNRPGPVEHRALIYAFQKGVTIVCAAGNDGRDGVSFPARFPECLAVSAVGPDKQLAPYSNYGDEIGIAGPGGNQRMGQDAGVLQNTIHQDTSNPFGRGQFREGFFSLQGTSMASPHVAGVAALLVSMGIKDPNEIRTILRRSAVVTLPSNQYGAGLLDAAAAIQATGKKPAASRETWVALAVAAALLLLFVGKEDAFVALLFLGAGYYFPILMEKTTRFGAAANIFGHSVALPVVWLLTPQLTRSSLAGAAAMALGLATHFALDIQSGASPFQVQSQSRISLWFFLNLAIAAYLILSAALRMGGGGKRS